MRGYLFWIVQIYNRWALLRSLEKFQESKYRAVPTRGLDRNKKGFHSWKKEEKEKELAERRRDEGKEEEE